MVKKTNIFISFLSSRMLRGQENQYIYKVLELKDASATRKPIYLLCFCRQVCSVAKNTIIFITFLSSRMLQGQDNEYIYSVFELMDAPGTRNS